MARTDRALAGEMGGHYVRRDPRVLCELELIPGSRIQEPRQKLRGKYVVNNSRIAELVWHFTKQNVRRRALGGDYFEKCSGRDRIKLNANPACGRFKFNVAATSARTTLEFGGPSIFDFATDIESINPRGTKAQNRNGLFARYHHSSPNDRGYSFAAGQRKSRFHAATRACSDRMKVFELSLKSWALPAYAI